MGQLLPEDALHWDSSRKERGAGELKTQVYILPFRMKAVGEFIWKSAEQPLLGD